MMTHVSLPPALELCRCHCAAPGKARQSTCRAAMNQPRAERKTHRGWTSAPWETPKAQSGNDHWQLWSHLYHSDPDINFKNTQMTSVDIAHILLNVRNRVWIPCLRACYMPKTSPLKSHGTKFKNSWLNFFMRYVFPHPFGLGHCDRQVLSYSVGLT